MDKIMDKARSLERENLKNGIQPNPSLTSPEEAAKYGWEIKGREVKKMVAKKMKSRKNKTFEKIRVNANEYEHRPRKQKEEYYGNRLDWDN